MYLLRAELHGVGPFEHLDLSFVDEQEQPRRVIVIQGGGGTGKTSLLAAIGSSRPGHATAQAVADLDLEGADVATLHDRSRRVTGGLVVGGTVATTGHHQRSGGERQSEYSSHHPGKANGAEGRVGSRAAENRRGYVPAGRQCNWRAATPKSTTLMSPFRSEFSRWSVPIRLRPV